jgi:hypothetical protein
MFRRLLKMVRGQVRFARRYSHGERASFPFLTFTRHRAPVHPYEFLHEREADAGAFM